MTRSIKKDQKKKKVILFFKQQNTKNKSILAIDKYCVKTDWKPSFMK
jgi:hypothetical protein